MIKGDESLVLTAPVMIPNFRDCDFERGETPLTVEQITAFKESFEQYGFIDKHHSIRGPSDKSHLIGSVLKSFQLEDETSFSWLDGSIHSYPAGTWMLTSEISDPVAIKQVKNGEINGYSASVFTKNVADNIKASLKASEGMLIKDVHDPRVAVVSLVRKPCVGDAKFCKVNGEKMSEDNAKSKLDSITKILGIDKSEYATKSDVDELKEDLDSSFKAYKDEIAETVGEAIKSALAEISVKEDKKEEEDKKKDDKAEEESSDEKTDESDKKGEEEDQKKKGSAKGQKIHNGKKENEKVFKSDSAIVYDMMGRSLDGTPKKE